MVLAEEPRPAGQADAGFAALFTGDQAVVTFALTAMMFVSSGTYYGVTNAPGVATGVDDVYTAQMLATVLEFPTVLALAPLADRFGRKAAMTSFS